MSPPYDRDRPADQMPGRSGVPGNLWLSTASLERVHACWDAVAELGPAEPEAALDRALHDLAALVDAQNAFWFAVLRVRDAARDDALCGWRPRVIRYLRASPADKAFFERSERLARAGALDESAAANVREAGVFRARLLRELVPPEWYRSPFYEAAYHARDIRDAIFVAAPVNVDAESYFGFHRKGDRPPFTAEERDVLAHAIRGMSWLHRPALLAHGLVVSQKPLTPTERRVVDLLITGHAEKQIAVQLGMGIRTAHHHVTVILRKFGVHSRAALMALWLGRPPAK